MSLNFGSARRTLLSVVNTPDSNPDSKLAFSDRIAFDQFVLAVERNFLLHVTAGLNLTIVGLAMFRFFSQHKNDLYELVGVALFTTALLVAGKGLYDFVVMRKELRDVKAVLESWHDLSLAAKTNNLSDCCHD